MWSFIQTTHCGPEAFNLGNCWIAISLAKESGLILSGRLGKHTDAFLAKLVVNTAGKTACRFWNTDDWGGYEQVLPLQFANNCCSVRVLRGAID